MHSSFAVTQSRRRNKHCDVMIFEGFVVWKDDRLEDLSRHWDAACDRREDEEDWSEVESGAAKIDHERVRRRSRKGMFNDWIKEKTERRKWKQTLRL